jgi:imidazole glycerol-phosphate synthase subunit HisH
VTRTPLVAVLDYASGNVHSAVKALAAAGADARLTADRALVLEADGLVVPGVGAFRAVMEALRASGGDELIDRRLAGGRPVLGICVGMQVLFGRGVERGDDTPGLGEGSTLFAGVEDERFYFVHSFAAQQWSLEVQPPFPTPSLTWATHGSRFLAAVENGALSATQFHPEKSGAAGIRLLSNWIGSLSAG